MGDHRCVSRLVVSSAIYWTCTIGCAFADSFVGGHIFDAITKRPVAGADVYVEYSSRRIGAAKSDGDGVYRVPFVMPSTIPATAFATITASGAGHAASTENLQIMDGSSGAVKDLELYPIGLLECRSQAEHSVIIGNFLPPSPAGTLSDLSRRIAKSLEFSLKTRLQAVHLILDKQPSFEPCESAKPATSKLGAGYAKALKADAFVDGDVSHDKRLLGYAVSFYVSDAYDFFPDPQLASNRNLELDTPSAVSVSDETHLAVLASIAAGLAKRKDCATALQVISVGERLIEEPITSSNALRADYFAQLRKGCEEQLPNVGLRKTTK
ncbi:hypothetical protein ABIB90_002344 [Bradyrhizobium sp. JR4.1]|uniref:hypothetical protein n=1 Tax=Bradyrhizobium sp. JR4.1 TaxID=3156372 RepID=UPI0033978218